MIEFDKAVKAWRRAVGCGLTIEHTFVGEDNGFAITIPHWRSVLIVRSQAHASVVGSLKEAESSGEKQNHLSGMRRFVPENEVD